MKNISLILSSVLAFQLASLAFLPVVKAEAESTRPKSMLEQQAVGKSTRFYRYLGIASGELGVDGRPLVQGRAMKQKQTDAQTQTQDQPEPVNTKPAETNLIK
jgi:hypothetical protein